MATLVNKVRAITRSTASETSDAQVIEFLNDAAAFVISHIPKELLRAYASETTGYSGSAGIDYENNTILGVKRGYAPCKEVNEKEALWLEPTSGSYMIPTEQFPKYYVRAGKVFIKPNPTTGALGYIDYIAEPTIDNSTEDLFGNLEHIVIYEAVSQDFQALAGYFSTSTAVTDSMAHWLNDEDSEMVQTAAQLVQHFNTKSAEYHNKAIQAIELHIKNSSEMIAVQSRGQ